MSEEKFKKTDKFEKSLKIRELGSLRSRPCEKSMSKQRGRRMTKFEVLKKCCMVAMLDLMMLINNAQLKMSNHHEIRQHFTLNIVTTRLELKLLVCHVSNKTGTREGS